MVTDTVISAMLGLMSGLFGLFPSLTLPDESPVQAYFLNQGRAMNDLFPFRTLLTALAAGLAVMLALSIWDFIVWVFHQFWGAS